MTFKIRRAISDCYDVEFYDCNNKLEIGFMGDNEIVSSFCTMINDILSQLRNKDKKALLEQLELKEVSNDN